MKKITAAVMISVFFFGCGRFVKVPDDQRKIRKVFEVNLTKDEIFEKSI